MPYIYIVLKDCLWMIKTRRNDRQNDTLYSHGTPKYSPLRVIYYSFRIHNKHVACPQVFTVSPYVKQWVWTDRIEYTYIYNVMIQPNFVPGFFWYMSVSFSFIQTHCGSVRSVVIRFKVTFSTGVSTWFMDCRTWPYWFETRLNPIKHLIIYTDAVTRSKMQMCLL